MSLLTCKYINVNIQNVFVGRGIEKQAHRYIARGKTNDMRVAFNIRLRMIRK